MASHIRGLTAFRTALVGLMLGIAPARAASAQDRPRVRADGTDSLKQLSIEQLINVQVTSVSRRPEQLTEAPSAIQVITGEEIRRAGATNLPEALRLATNLQVAQAKSYEWLVTARGFSTPDFGGIPRANKLLVLIDGRTVYTPLHAGVLWDVQGVLLEDVDRIEVISGPGGALWGANAVNGVINIITRRATETLGGYVTAGVGSQVEDVVAARYGVALGAHAAVRVYAQRFDRSPTELADGSKAFDPWEMTQGGFRLGGTSADGRTTWTVQGDAYGVVEGSAQAIESAMDGQNVIARWSRTLSPTSQLRIQAYADRTWRKFPQVVSEELLTYDLDLQHRLTLGARHRLVWGGGVRVIRDAFTDALFVFRPSRRTAERYNVFAQDQIVLRPERWLLTVGAKLEKDFYAGAMLQPSVRLSWTSAPGRMLWGAVSRAVRAPSRIDRDITIPAAHLSGTKDFQAERMIAYELGYRMVPTPTLSFSAALYYNDADRLRSLNVTPTQDALFYANDVEGETWGAELGLTWQPTRPVRIRAGYTHLEADLRRTDPQVIAPPDFEANDPSDQVQVHAMITPARGWELDVIGRYVSALPAPSPKVDDRATLDARIAWHSGPLELALIGQNLSARRQAQFGPQLMPRSILGRATVRW